MFKKGIDYTVHDSKIDQNGRYIILDISLFDQAIFFIISLNISGSSLL
jgi:hypothetical protein